MRATTGVTSTKALAKRESLKRKNSNKTCGDQSAKKRIDNIDSIENDEEKFSLVEPKITSEEAKVDLSSDTNMKIQVVTKVMIVHLLQR